MPFVCHLWKGGVEKPSTLHGARMERCSLQRDPMTDKPIRDEGPLRVLLNGQCLEHWRWAQLLGGGHLKEQSTRTGHPPGSESSTSRALPIAAQASSKSLSSQLGWERTKPTGSALSSGPSFSGYLWAPLCARTVLSTGTQQCTWQTGWSQSSWNLWRERKTSPGETDGPRESIWSFWDRWPGPSFIQRNTCLLHPLPNDMEDWNPPGRGNYQHPWHLRHLMIWRWKWVFKFVE